MERFWAVSSLESTRPGFPAGLLADEEEDMFAGEERGRPRVSRRERVRGKRRGKRRRGEKREKRRGGDEEVKEERKKKRGRSGLDFCAWE